MKTISMSLWASLEGHSSRWLFVISCSIALVFISGCSGGDNPAGPPAADTQAPTAVLEVLDSSGQPLAGNTVAYGQSFMLSGANSTDAGGGTIASYEWTTPTGTSTTTTSTLTIDAATTPIVGGTYSYSLAVVDDSGNKSSTVTIQVRITPALTCINAQYDVDSTADVSDASPGDMICDDGNGNCTLRAAIEEANACTGPNTIMIPAATYVLTQGALPVSDELTVTGGGVGKTIIDGNSNSRIFTVNTGVASIAISDLTMQNGKTTSGGAMYINGNSPVTLRRTHIRNNWGTSHSGAVGLASDAVLVIENSTISGNRADNLGGSAFLLDTNASLTIRSSTISNNELSAGYGVIYDRSHSGGPSITIENSTISGNKGTAIRAQAATVSINNATITNNSTGLYSGASNGTASISVSNTILYGNGTNCTVSGGTLSSAGHNIDSRNTCGFAATGDLVNTDPLLGPLADNGGATKTRGLKTGSPATGAGDDTLCPSTDQRGVSRPAGSACDIGAYEDDGIMLTTTCLSPILVTSTLDAVDANIGDGLCDDGAGNCTLRAAIQEANACVGADVITLPAGTYPLTLAGISDNVAVMGDLDINDELTINGAGAATTIIDGSAPFDDRIFDVLNNMTTTFDGMTLQGVNVAWNLIGGGIRTYGDITVSNCTISGNTAGSGVAVYAGDAISTVTISSSTMSNNTGGGLGAVYVAGTLNTSGSTFSGNMISGYGGAIYGHNGSTLNISTALVDNNGGAWAAVVGMDNSAINITDSTVSNSVATNDSTAGVMGWSDSTINITRSTISGNEGGVRSTGAYGYGGGSVLNITDSTISGNSINAAGAGISTDGSFTITGSTISGNTGWDGAIFLLGSGTITNSTISGNTNNGINARGGGIGGSGTVTLLYSTVAGNSAQFGGGIGLNNGTLIISNSIIAGNSTDCGLGGNMVVTSNGYNIESQNTCGFASTGDLVDTDPLLSALASNGSPTMTHALQTGSPAIDAANDAVCPATDQRGVSRPQGAHCDIGAYEAP